MAKKKKTAVKKKTAKKPAAKKRPAKAAVRRPAKKKVAVRKQASAPKSEGGTRVLTQKVIFSVSPEELYDAYVDIAKHAEFTGAAATGGATIGETMTAWDGYITAKTLSLIPNRQIVQEWTTTEWPENQPPSLLELTFEEIPEGTLLIMKHSDIPAAQADAYNTGWSEYYWDPLKRYFSEQGAAEDALASEFQDD